MTRALIIGEKEIAAARAALERARDKPLPLGLIKQVAVQDTPHMTLADRQATHWRPRSETIEIPMGYRLSISFEQQPVGTCIHLSISIDRPGNVPNPVAVAVICDLVRVKFPEGALSIWTEEFEPGHCAVNILALAELMGSSP